MKLQNNKKCLILPVVSGVVLGGLMMCFISPVFKDSVYADSSANTQAELNVDSIINISAPPTVTINCTPGATAASATLCTSTATISVTTNNLTGYTLQMNATNGSPTALTNSATSPAATIPTLSQAYSSANFPVNSWGYTGGLDKSGETGGYNCASNYCPILAYQVEPPYAPNHVIKATDAPATTSNTNVTFGAKVDINKPSGTYTTSVTFTAVTNYVPTPITNGMSMVDIDANICSDTPLETTYTVVDPRDNKSYAVAKLADGNCWMLDNLALDLVASKNNINSSNTNALNTYLNYLKGNSTGTASDQYPTAGVSYWPSGRKSFSAPFVAIKNANNENWNPDTVAPVTYGNGSGKIGAYYNYCAASAGSYCWGNGDSYTGSPSSDPKPNSLYDIDADICPAGWHIPVAYGSGGYYYLYNTAYSANQTNFKNALSTPLSGLFSYGSASSQGSYGYFFSSTWESTSNVMSLKVSDDDVNSSGSGARTDGISLRCVVSGV